MLMHTDAVADWAQWVTAAIAFGAAWFACGQVLEAQRTRAHPTWWPTSITTRKLQWFDLAVKNFGQTPAYKIRATLPPLPIPPCLDPDTGENIAYLFIPDVIAVLAPRREWRALWNSRTAMSPETRRMNETW